MRKNTYVIFEDEVGKVFILLENMIDRSLFAGSIGELTEVERNITGYNLKELFERVI